MLQSVLLRGIALGRRARLFAGSDRDGKRAAAIRLELRRVCVHPCLMGTHSVPHLTTLLYNAVALCTYTRARHDLPLPKPLKEVTLALKLPGSCDIGLFADV
jgi:hypothetical protein